jgi:hypothetical protein
VWLFGPLEWSRVQVVFRREAINSIFEFVDGVKDTAGEAPLRQLGKEPLDGVEPGSGALVQTFEVVGMPLCFDYFLMWRVRHSNLRLRVWLRFVVY